MGRVYAAARGEWQRAHDFSKQQGGPYYVTKTIKVGNHSFTLAAKLTSTPRSPSPEQGHADYAGTLTVTVELLLRRGGLAVALNVIGLGILGWRY